MRTILVSLLLSAAVQLAAAAQTSASFKLQEGTFNAGGNPSPVLASASYKITLDSVGETVGAPGLSSASYRSDAGFPERYPPPGEVSGPRFTSKITLVWDPEPSVGRYDVYRGTLGDLPDTFGTCLAGGVAAATVTDTQVPVAGECFFYLVTAENRLDEEGTLGYRSNGSERPNVAPCP